MNKNVIIINLKSIFLPTTMLQTELNNEFLEQSINLNSKVVPYFDKFAVDGIQKIVDYTNAEIVISDDYFWTDNLDRTKEWCSKNGLRLSFHDQPFLPKKNHKRIDRIVDWNKKNNEKIVLIIDEDYTTKNLYDLYLYEIHEYESYLQEFGNILGDKRRASLVPKRKYAKYENFKHYLPDESKLIVHIDDKVGISQDVLTKAWGILNY